MGICTECKEGAVAESTREADLVWAVWALTCVLGWIRDGSWVKRQLRYASPPQRAGFSASASDGAQPGRSARAREESPESVVGDSPGVVGVGFGLGAWRVKKKDDIVKVSKAA